MRLTIKKTGIILDLYHPNLFVRQFGMSQLLFTPLVEDLWGMFLFTYAAKEETLEVYLEFFRDKLDFLSLFDYSLYFHYTKEFDN